MQVAERRFLSGERYVEPLETEDGAELGGDRDLVARLSRARARSRYGRSRGWAGLWMRVDSANEPNLAFDNMPDRGPRGTTEWRRYEVVLDVAKEASEIYFGAVLAGNGTVWIDDLAIEEVPESVPVTARAPKVE